MVTQYFEVVSLYGNLKVSVLDGSIIERGKTESIGLLNNIKQFDVDTYLKRYNLKSIPISVDIAYLPYFDMENIYHQGEIENANKMYTVQVPRIDLEELKIQKKSIINSLDDISKMEGDKWQSLSESLEGVLCLLDFIQDEITDGNAVQEII